MINRIKGYLQGGLVTTIAFLCVFMLPHVAKAAPQPTERYSTSATACQPANLAQAQNLGANWHQKGIRNNNLEGSGRSFFVVCPVVFGDNLAFDTLGDDILVKVTSANITVLGTQVACTGYWWREATLRNTVSDAVELNSANDIFEVNLDNLVNDDIEGYSDSIVVVCNLPPQTGLRSLNFDYD